MGRTLRIIISNDISIVLNIFWPEGKTGKEKDNSNSLRSKQGGLFSIKSNSHKKHEI